MSFGDWGNLASITGVAITFWTLWVAQGAKEAAQEARAKARTRDLTEELEQARSKIGEMSLLIKSGRWDAASLRAQEIIVACALARTRWGDQLSETGRNN